VFGRDPVAMAELQRSEEEPSLCDLVQKWLERTPGLEEGPSNFWTQYRDTVDRIIEEQRLEAEAAENPVLKNHMLGDVQKKKRTLQFHLRCGHPQRSGSTRRTSIQSQSPPRGYHDHLLP